MRKPTHSMPRAPTWLVTILVVVVTGALWAIVCCLAIELLGILGVLGA